jgi:hypothetical protein
MLTGHVADFYTSLYGYENTSVPTAVVGLVGFVLVILVHTRLSVQSLAVLRHVYGSLKFVYFAFGFHLKLTPE